MWRENFGQSTIHLSELKKLLIENIAVTKRKAMYLSSDDINYDTNTFKFFMSSILFLKTALKAEYLRADATYKFLWEGFPVHIIWTTDSKRSSHCYGISVYNEETTADFEFTLHPMKLAISKYFGVNYRSSVLISDAAISIKNAFQNILGVDQEFFVEMFCYHMRKNVVSNINKLEQSKKFWNKIVYEE